ncbi:hypothetical protein [Sphingomicrobium arenosum]|uniref:hypothetical protein n=1 Tax=Sphingomicrobium arenosum TaxID=2233861 RepID=UPI0022404C7D|nr:hypothetical protein [Sphingomicrobium arenosum]
MLILTSAIAMVAAHTQDDEAATPVEDEPIVVTRHCEWRYAPTGRRVGAHKKCMTQDEYRISRTTSGTRLSAATLRYIRAQEQAMMPRGN